MITREEYKQLKAFARIDGAILGVIMMATFMAFVHSFTDAFWQIAYIIGIIVVPVFVALRVRNYRDKIVEKRVSFRRAAGYSMFCFGYASLVFSLSVLVYLQYFDNGTLLMGLQEYFRTPEMAQAMKAYGVDAATMKQEVDALSSLRPVDVAFTMISNTLMSGLFCSLFIAVISRREPRRVA
ncbi:MAG: DUF4199 domain-containing protein [Prevotella sp.]|nr:DUF4199 domain-containing protein [Prevotella sp.]